MTGIDRNAGLALILRVAVYPSMIGSCISIKIKSGRCFAIAASVLTVFGLGDFTIDTAKHIANNLAIIFLVLHHQYAFAHAAGSTCRSTTTGSINANVEP